MKRKLAAIMVADVVGYSRLMEADEEGTAGRVAKLREVVDAQIAETDGRVFKAMGDAILAEFPSPINAVRAAVGIRAGLTLVQRDADEPMRMRYGLHLADVLIDGDDLIGDGVNLAARIQAAAEPDAIEISAALFESVRRSSPYAFDDLGEQRFKNIGESVRVYRLRGEIERHRYQVTPEPRPQQHQQRPHSLAVMPIEFPAGHEDSRYLAEGIAEELNFELGRFRKLFVTSRSATAVLAEQRADPVTVGQRLGVRYVLGGILRQLGGQVRLSLSLVETETGGVVWSDRVSLPFEELVEGLDELVARIAATVLGRIQDADIASARRMRPDSMTAYEFHLRGLEYHRLGGVTDANLQHALDWFERAIEADPAFARPHAMWVCARSGLPEFDLDEGEQRTQRALELDPNDPEANRVMGSILMHRRSFDAARRYHEKAMAMSPTDAYIRARSAAFYNFAGEPKRALELLEEADELDPFLPVWCVEERAAALYNAGRYAEAAEATLELTFQTRRSRLYRAASLMALGDADGARRAVLEALAVAPDLTTAFIDDQEHYQDEAVTQTMMDRLASAGLPITTHADPGRPAGPPPLQEVDRAVHTAR
ncbi:MAG TPA: adenylate/guanylate cyclase domain-containing protein [Acidimicrobiia bacterium]